MKLGQLRGLGQVEKAGFGRWVPWIAISVWLGGVTWLWLRSWGYLGGKKLPR